MNTEGSNPQQFIPFFTTSIMDVVKGKLHQVAKIKLPYLSHSKKVNIKSLSAVPTQQKKRAPWGKTKLKKILIMF